MTWKVMEKKMISIGIDPGVSGDYTLMLSYRGMPLGVFSHDIVTISVIRAACQEHLEAIGAS